MSSMHSRASTKVKVFLFLMVLVLAAALGYWLWPASGAAQQTSQARPGMPSRGFMMDAVPVSLVRVKQGTFVEQIRSLGTVTPWNRVEITSQVSGTLERIHFQEGQRVEQGDLLAEIDPRDYQAELLQAEGALEEVRAQLHSARLDLKRYQQLRAEDSIAQQTLDHQQATLAQLEGSLKVRQGQRDAARLNLEHSRITAPISGRLGLRAVDVGNHVAAGSTVLATLTQLQPTSVSFSITEHDIPAVLQAFLGSEPLRVQAWSRDESVLLAGGVLDSLDNEVDVATGTLRLKGRFANEDNRLFARQFVNVALYVAEHENQLMIPSDAIQFGGQGSFVWRAKPDNTVEIVRVQVLRSGTDISVIQSGLNAGDAVVLEGVDRLKDGSRIEVISDSSVEVGSQEAAVSDTPPMGRGPRDSE